MENFDGNEALNLAFDNGGVYGIIALFLLVVLVRGRQVFEGVADTIRAIGEMLTSLEKERTVREKNKLYHEREMKKLEAKRPRNSRRR